MVSIVVLSVVFVLIAIRQIGRFRLQIWQVMLLGALTVLLTGQISPVDALKAINPDVMLFLFGMFVSDQLLIEHGVSQQYIDYLFPAEDMRNHPCFPNAPADQTPDQQCQLFSDLNRGFHDLVDP
jgi:hypothetical protein